MLGVRSFDAFAAERRLAKTEGLASLRGKVLGVDSDWLVMRALSVHNKREPLVYAVGGFPTSLEAHVDALLERFKAHDVRPLFVISGTALVPAERPFERPDAAVRQRAQAWSLYEEGQGEQAVKLFDEAEPFPLRSGVRAFVKLLINKGVEYTIAPHTAAAQLAYLAAEQFVDAVYASSDYLLYEQGGDRLVTLVDVKTESVQWVSKRAVLDELRMPHAVFVEAAVACGCGLSPRTFPQIEHLLASQPGVNALSVAQDIVQANGSMFAAVAAFPEPDYLDRFQKGVAAAGLQAVQKADGHVDQAVDPDRTPSDTHVVIGQRLPDEFYFYLSRGLIGPDILTGLSHNTLVERAPLDGGDVEQYRKYVLGLQALKTKINSFLVQTLHRYFQFNPMSTVFWFEPGAPPHKFERIPTPLYTSIGTKWRLTEAVLDGVDATLAGLVRGLAREEFASKTVFASTSGPASRPPVLKTDREIIASALGRALEAAEFVDNTHNLTEWGWAFAAGIAAAPQFAEGLLVATALIKAGALHGNPYTPSYGSDSTVPEDNWQRLVSRVAVHVPLQHKPVGYVGPLSRALLSYQSFVAAQTKTFRWLAESTLTSLLANGDADRLSRETDAAWQSLVAEIPFADAPSAATGIAMQSYLEEVVASNDTKAALATTQTMFSAAADLPADLASAFTFWDAVVAVATAANAAGVLSNDAASQFTAADEWLKTKRL